MKLSKKCEYALRALTELALNYERGREVTLISEIARRQKMPLRYLEQILLHLRNSGVLVSKRGVGGGYALSRLPGEISVGEVVSIVDGPLSFSGQTNKDRREYTGDEISTTVQKVMKELGAAMKEAMEDISLRDLAGRAKKLGEQKRSAFHYAI